MAGRRQEAGSNRGIGLDGTIIVGITEVWGESSWVGAG